VHLHHLPAGNAAQAQRIVLPKQLLACRWQPSHVIKALDVLRPDFLFVKEPPVDCIGAVDMISHSSQAPDLKLLYPPGRVPWRPPPPCRRGCCPSCRGAERLQGCSSRCLPSPQRPFCPVRRICPCGDIPGRARAAWVEACRQTAALQAQQPLPPAALSTREACPLTAP